MLKPRRVGRPPNQPTNHTIYGSWEGAQVLLLDLCGLPDPPIYGCEVTPDHLLCTRDHRLRDPTMHPSLGMRSEDRPITILAFLEPFPHF